MTRFVRLCLTALLCFGLATAASAGDINIRLPMPPLPIFVPEPPLFLVPPTLGFHVSVDTPDDIFFVDQRYYVPKGDIWYVGPGYNGPWQTIKVDRLPPGLRKHHHDEIRRERDREYKRYHDEGEGYHGKKYRPEKNHGHDKDKNKSKSKNEDNGKHDDHGHDDDHGKGKHD